MFSLRAARQVVLERPQGADAVMAPDEQSLVQRRPFGGHGSGRAWAKPAADRSRRIGGVSLPVVRPVLGFKPKITLIGPLDSAAPEQLSDDALATLRESLSNVVRNAEADAGTCISRGGHDRQEADHPGGGQRGGHRPSSHARRAQHRGPGPRLRRARHGRAALRAGTTFTWVAFPLEGKWELITDAVGGKPCSLRPLFSGAATGVRDFGPDPVDRWPLIRSNPPLPQWEQQPGRGG